MPLNSKLLVVFHKMIFKTFTKHKPKDYCTLYNGNTIKSTFINRHLQKIPVENDIPEKYLLKLAYPYKKLTKPRRPKK